MKNKWIAAVGCFFFGPFGFIYFGLKYLLSGLLLSMLFWTILAAFGYLWNLPTPIYYSFAFIYAWIGYETATAITNTNKTFKEITAILLIVISMGFQIQLMLCAGFKVIQIFNAGYIGKGLLALFLGLPAFGYIIYMITGFIVTTILAFLD